MTHNHEAENTATILAISEPSASEWRERAEKAEAERKRIIARLKELGVEGDELKRRFSEKMAARFGK